ncbi:hypothetical protein [Abyssisolibacter fermentans]|uniref:hypothetical protein n=1 Tax=Abyssisolibacter fermentans TaxID=1766203 RepID=UPI00082E9880|nr:hypothetical protein [Abyssisolibacter fermentans]
MNISKREKILLAILVILLGSYSFYNFIASPYLDEINLLKQDLNNKTTELKNVNISKSEIEDIQKEIKALHAKIWTVTERFFPSYEQEKIITLLDKMLKDSNLDGYSMSFIPVEIIDIYEEKDNNSNNEGETLLNEIADIYFSPDDKKQNKENKENNEKNNGEQKPIKLKKASVSIYFRGSYNGIINFLKKIEHYNKKIIVSSLNINVSNDEKDYLNGSIILDLYSIKKLHKQDTEYLAWDYDNDYGKNNPFYYQDNSVRFDELYIEDFVMTVKPESSVMPTVTIKQNSDYKNETFIYADNKGIENIEIEVISKDDKYYYKYKTEDMSYPNDYNNSIEFMPNNDFIYMTIYTHERNSREDISGCNIKASNLTDKSMIIRVINDDKNRPRVTVIKKGNIIIKD